VYVFNRLVLDKNKSTKSIFLGIPRNFYKFRTKFLGLTLNRWLNHRFKLYLSATNYYCSTLLATMNYILIPVNSINDALLITGITNVLDLSNDYLEICYEESNIITTVLNKTNDTILLYGCIDNGIVQYIDKWEPNNMNFLLYDLLNPDLSKPSPFYMIVLQFVPILHLKAYLYRKKKNKTTAESGYYVVEETLYLPQGLYKDLTEVVAILNQTITLRGERNGFIYHFLTKNGKLVLESAHKQPEPSFIDITVLNNGIGLTENSTLRLRTRERLQFPDFPCNFFY